MYADPSVWYRCYQPAFALRNLKSTVDIVHYKNLELGTLNRYDFIIFFRPQYSARFVDIFHSADRSGVALCASYDDLFFDISTLRLSHFRLLNVPQAAILSTRPQNYAKALYFFDRFIVSTDPMARFLANILPNASCHTLYNSVSPEILSLCRKATSGLVERVPRRIGYFAGGRSHSADLARVSGPLVRAIKQCKATFFCVETVEVPKSLIDTGVVMTVPRLTYTDMMLAYASCAITIAPLSLDTFTNSKSGIKSLESTAAGAFSVATPIEDIVRVGGDLQLLANSNDEWYENLCKALSMTADQALIEENQHRLADRFCTDTEARRFLEWLQ